MMRWPLFALTFGMSKKIVRQPRIGALEVVPNLPMGLDLATLRVEQKLQHETDTQNLGKRKISLLVFMQFAVTTL